MADEVIDLCSSDEEDVAPLPAPSVQQQLSVQPSSSTTFKSQLDEVLQTLSKLADKITRQQTIDRLLFIFEVYIRNLIEHPDSAGFNQDRGGAPRWVNHKRISVANHAFKERVMDTNGAQIPSQTRRSPCSLFLEMGAVDLKLIRGCQAAISKAKRQTQVQVILSSDSSDNDEVEQSGSAGAMSGLDSHLQNPLKRPLVIPRQREFNGSQASVSPTAANPGKPAKRQRNCGEAAGTHDLTSKGWIKGLIRHGWLVLSSMGKMPEAAGSNWCIQVQCACGTTQCWKLISDLNAGRGKSGAACRGRAECSNAAVDDHLHGTETKDLGPKLEKPKQLERLGGTREKVGIHQLVLDGASARAIAKLCISDPTSINSRTTERDVSSISHIPLAGNHCTALHLAILRAPLGIVEVLLYYGADPNAQTSAGHTPLMLAVLTESEPKAQALILEAQTDIEIECHQKRNALDLAVDRRNLQLTKLILSSYQKAYDPCVEFLSSALRRVIQSPSSEMAPDSESEISKYSVAAQLIEAGAQKEVAVFEHLFDGVDESKVTIAIQARSYRLLSQLIQNVSRLDDENLMTVLILAVQNAWCEGALLIANRVNTEAFTSEHLVQLVAAATQLPLHQDSNMTRLLLYAGSHAMNDATHKALIECCHQASAQTFHQVLTSIKAHSILCPESTSPAPKVAVGIQSLPATERATARQFINMGYNETIVCNAVRASKGDYNAALDMVSALSASPSKPSAAVREPKSPQLSPEELTTVFAQVPRRPRDALFEQLLDWCGLGSWSVPLPDVASTMTELSEACSRQAETPMQTCAGDCPQAKQPAFVWLNHPVEARSVKIDWCKNQMTSCLCTGVSCGQDCPSNGQKGHSSQRSVFTMPRMRGKHLLKRCEWLKAEIEKHSVLDSEAVFKIHHSFKEVAAWTEGPRLETESNLHLDVLEALCRDILSCPTLFSTRPAFSAVVQFAAMTSVLALEDHGIENATNAQYNQSEFREYVVSKMDDPLALVKCMQLYTDALNSDMIPSPSSRDFCTWPAAMKMALNTKDWSYFRVFKLLVTLETFVKNKYWQQGCGPRRGNNSSVWYSVNNDTEQRCLKANSIEEGCLSYYECHQWCQCLHDCPGRAVGRGTKAPLEIFWTKEKEWGIRTREDLAKGTFLCEYVGEIDSERGATGDEPYVMDLADNKPGKEDKECITIDAQRFGTGSRFFNHTCWKPNVTRKRVFTHHHDPRVPSIAFFTTRKVEANEELVICYKSVSLGFACKCGSKQFCKSKHTDRHWFDWQAEKKEDIYE